ncbi:HEAT repeat domain-containing protein [Streptomyces sp. NPDC058655]|uniref:HEAT repeat domain-containing protein n=1 Tax=Streptomyces sp. NPDC058655 TaxID=3346577 RepID=UPI003655E355
MSGVKRQEAERVRAAAESLLRGGADPVQPLPDAAEPHDWTALDQALRAALHGWRGATAAYRTDLALCHPDGRIRERALYAPHPRPEFVAIRCADWVPQVRRRARHVLAGALAADPPSVLLRLTPLVLRLGRREQGGWALELFETELRSRAGSPALAALHGSPDLPVRRLAARLAVEAGGADVRELARRAASEHDPGTSRTWADAALARAAADGPDDESVDALLGGHSPMVRSAGVVLLLRAGRGAEAGRFLSDRSGLVRACARWAVRQGSGDPYALTRAQVTDPGLVTAAAVTGFAECAGRGDAPLLRTLLDHPAGAVRAAAVAGLGLLDTHDAALLEPLLDDPSPAVARAVSLSLRGCADRPPVDRLVERVGPGWPPHTRRAAYRLLRARGGTPWLAAAVDLLADGDAQLRRTAAQHLQSLWSPSRPPDLPSGDPEVGALLDRCTEVFGDYVIGRMRRHLGLPQRDSTTNGH